MENAKKVLLVDPLHKTSAEKKLTKLDEEITRTLTSELPDDEKAKRYNATLRNYKYFDETRPKKIDADKAIINDLDSNQRQHAKRLLDLIKPHVTWNEQGELVYKNDIIHNSSITELLDDVLQNTEGEDPVGWPAFADVLKAAATPRQLIKNTKRRRYVYPRARSSAHRSRPRQRWEEAK